MYTLSEESIPVYLLYTEYLLNLSESLFMIIFNNNNNFFVLSIVHQRKVDISIEIILLFDPIPTYDTFFVVGFVANVNYDR